MSELARQRNARDLWISRGHLWAMGSGVLFLAVFAFASGFVLGRTHQSQAPDSVPVASGDALVELLARIDASAASHGAVEALTFPDALAGETPVAPPPAGPPREARSLHLDVRARSEDARHRFTLVLAQSEDSAALEARAEALVSRGLAAYVVPGVPAGTSWLAVGWFADAPAADAAKSSVSALWDDPADSIRVAALPVAGL